MEVLSLSWSVAIRIELIIKSLNLIVSRIFQPTQTTWSRVLRKRRIRSNCSFIMSALFFDPRYGVCGIIPDSERALPLSSHTHCSKLKWHYSINTYIANMIQLIASSYYFLKQYWLDEYIRLRTKAFSFLKVRTIFICSIKY